MKTLKLFLIFAILVGGIFLLINWKKVISKDEKKSYTKYIDINQTCDGIRKSWKKEKDWNAKLYQSQKKEILQDHSLGRYEDEESYNTVRNCLRETTTNKVHEAIFREFHNANCNDKLVKENYAGIGILKKEENMNSDDRIKKIVNCYDLYTKISAFARSKHRVTAWYDIADNSWTSFNTFKNNVINAARRYRDNAIYKSDLSNITSLKEGLNHAGLEKIMDKQKNNFYQSLSNQIISYFVKTDIEEPNLTRLNAAYDAYTRETTLYTASLASLVKDFRKEYEEKMKEQEEKIKVH